MNQQVFVDEPSPERCIFNKWFFDHTGSCHDSDLQSFDLKIYKHFAVAYINVHDVYDSLQRNGQWTIGCQLHRPIH